MNNDMDDVIEIFTAEGKEALDEVELILLKTQKISQCRCVDIKDDINAVFRYFHSIKGTASFIDLSAIVEVSHEAETLLDILRKKDDDTILSEEIISVLFRTIDILRSLIDQVTNTTDDDSIEEGRNLVIHQLKSTIKQTREGKPVVVTAPPPPSAEPEPTQEIQAIEFNDEDLITPEIANKFSQESVEIIDSVEETLLSSGKASPEEQMGLISEAFRKIHSFKGNCGFMQLGQLEKLSHLMENTLDSLRNSQIKFNDALIKTLLNMLDQIRDALAEFAKGNRQIFNFDVLYTLFKDQLTDDSEQATEQAPPAERELPPPPEKSKIDLSGITQPTPPAATKKPAPNTQLAVVKDTSTAEKKSLEKNDIRVDINKLDNLINLVGELVIAQSMVLINPHVADSDDENLERSIHHLSRISSELQDVAMSVRMVPLSIVFRKMIRLVYDVSKKMGKKVDIELIGEETEVDRNIIEQINDPLVHIIRNSVDHGIESPDNRIATNKNEEGKIVLAARHEGGEVWITVKDDGQGLNREKILAKAIERGLIKDNQMLTDDQIYNLIFEPGFSTADKITDISGRGVGMDVVKKNIEKLKGAINVHSTPGEGTEMVLRIPLTLAIIDGMMVRVGATCYTIPLLSVQESIKVENHHITITPDGQESILLRKDHIPIIRLYQHFNKTTEHKEIKGSVLIICESGKQKMALLVDEILGQLQTVIKSLPGYLSEMKGISGCTIMGNGEISLIIDITSLAETTRHHKTNKLLEVTT